MSSKAGVVSAVWMRLRSELRTRWRAWLGLALLIGLLLFDLFQRGLSCVLGQAVVAVAVYEQCLVRCINDLLGRRGGIQHQLVQFIELSLLRFRLVRVLCLRAYAGSENTAEQHRNRNCRNPPIPLHAVTALPFWILNPSASLYEATILPPVPISPAMTIRESGEIILLCNVRSTGRAPYAGS